jgi:hypothetical protein
VAANWLIGRGYSARSAEAGIKRNRCHWSMHPRHRWSVPAVVTLALVLGGCGAAGSSEAQPSKAQANGSRAGSSPAASTSAPSNATDAGTSPDSATSGTTSARNSTGGGVIPGGGPAHLGLLASGWAIPDSRYTPGAVLTTDETTVCTPGYSRSVRYVPASEKDQVYAEYGITSHVPYQYEIDHDISLELGGSNDVSNLWPEPNDKSEGNSKDRLENKLHELVCSGSLSLTDAQAAIKGDWTIAYRKYIGDLGTFHTNGRTAASPSSIATSSASSSSRASHTSGSSSAGSSSGSSSGGRPSGATALCNDGTYSYAAHHQGACSHHGGVAQFYS